MTWQAGKDRIDQLLGDEELERVTPDVALAQRLIADASLHLNTAEAANNGEDFAGAYQLAFDALRKSAASLLAVQGLRVTSRGGHIAIEDAVTAQFGNTVRAFKAFGRIRRARNRFEYPDTGTAGTSADDVADAIKAATEARDAAVTVLDQNLLTPW